MAAFPGSRPHVSARNCTEENETAQGNLMYQPGTDRAPPSSGRPGPPPAAPGTSRDGAPQSRSAAVPRRAAPPPPHSARPRADRPPWRPAAGRAARPGALPWGPAGGPLQCRPVCLGAGPGRAGPRGGPAGSRAGDGGAEGGGGAEPARLHRRRGCPGGLRPSEAASLRQWKREEAPLPSVRASEKPLARCPPACCSTD